MKKLIVMVGCASLGFASALMMGQARRAGVPTLEQRVSDLEQRVQALEQGRGAPAPHPAPAVVAPSPRSQWNGFEETAIDGTVQNIQNGTIFKTLTGNIYEVTDVVMEMVMELNPSVTVLTNGSQYRLIIDGVKKPLTCKKLGDGVVVGGGAEVIESKIDGEFQGFENDRIFKLRNGQIWQQTSFKTKYRYKYSPAVTIWKDGSQFKMKVDDMEDPVTVQRIK